MHPSRKWCRNCSTLITFLLRSILVLLLLLISETGGFMILQKKRQKQNKNSKFLTPRNITLLTFAGWISHTRNNAPETFFPPYATSFERIIAYEQNIITFLWNNWFASNSLLEKGFAGTQTSETISEAVKHLIDLDLDERLPYLPHSEKDLGMKKLDSGNFEIAWVFSRYAGFFPRAKNLHLGPLETLKCPSFWTTGTGTSLLDKTFGERRWFDHRETLFNVSMMYSLPPPTLSLIIR